MANLTTEICGIKVKNPIGVTSCDFGGHHRLTKRCTKQGIGWIIGKTVHKIEGPNRWPRPYFYSLRRFGNDLKDAWICSQMFHNMPFEKWLKEELPQILDVCEEDNTLFIGSCSGIGSDPKTWVSLLMPMEKAGVKIIELDTGGPHATFGADISQKDVGAPLALDADTAYKVTKACVESVNVPIIFKMTPQAINTAEIALAVEEAGAGAISANNAFYGCWIDHETGTFYGVPASMGGLIGRPWQLFSLAKILEVTKTVKIPVIGGGGIFTYDDIARHLMGGCTLTGMCSSVYSRGVKVLGSTIQKLNEWMDNKGYSSIKDIQGKAAKDFIYLRDWPRENPMSEKTPIIPKFDDKKCTKCGVCVDLCPYEALSLDKNTMSVPEVNKNYCMGCGWCVGHCPTQAIKMIHSETGEVVWNGYGTIKQWVK